MERPLKRAYEQYQGMKYQRREIIYLCKLTSKNIDGGQKAITRKLFSTLKNCLDTIEEWSDMERLTHILRIQLADIEVKWEKWIIYKTHNSDTT